MNKNANALGLAIAATLGAGGAEAATYAATLVKVQSWSSSGPSTLNITSSTATWSYDDVTGLLTQTGGTFNFRFTITPTTTLFRHLITGLVLGNGGAASASSFVCSEGNFGGNVAASLCGNYNFGANYIDESTATWGPGTAFTRTLGGDDVALGTQQAIGLYDGFSTVSWSGTTLVLANATCNPYAPGSVSGCSLQGGYNDGLTWTLHAGPQVPVPAAVWLFGSALAGLGAIRRRKQV
jgi:hypothetical protein